MTRRKGDLSAREPKSPGPDLGPLAPGLPMTDDERVQHLVACLVADAFESSDDEFLVGSDFDWARALLKAAFNWSDELILRVQLAYCACAGDQDRMRFGPRGLNAPRRVAHDGEGDRVRWQAWGPNQYANPLRRA